MFLLWLHKLCFCYLRDRTCNICNRKGHLARVCFQGKDKKEESGSAQSKVNFNKNNFG